MSSSEVGVEDAVRAFVARECAIPVDRIQPSTKLGDLGIDGDDGAELVESFAREFQVDLGAFDPGSHFGPEGIPLLGPLIWLGRLLNLNSSPEERAALVPITIADLIESVRSGRWVAPHQY